jgi:hypothetical protein
MTDRRKKQKERDWCKKEEAERMKDTRCVKGLSEHQMREKKRHRNEN